MPHVQQGVEQLLCLSVSRSVSQWTQKCKYANLHLNSSQTRITWRAV